VSQSKDQLVAIVDADRKRLDATLKNLQKKGVDPATVRQYTDYRRMFDDLGKELDAVFVATPNHHHALPSMMAMKRNIAVFCEKPLCHDIYEARELRKAAALSQAAAQMGNQGHCEDGYHRLCEFIAAGVVGTIKETHSWTDRSNGGVGPRPPSLPTPEGMDWDAWIGPAPMRKYHEDLHPHEWHGWYDFGNGSLGNMGCHVLDGVFWALDVDHPTSITAEEIAGGTKERLPTGTRLVYQIPARGKRPAFKAYWYDGYRPDGAGGAPDPKAKRVRSLPPLLAELRKQYPDEEFESNGSLYVGEKGVLYTGTYGGRMRLVPFEKMQTLDQPPRTLPRPKNVMLDFLDAVRAGKRQTAASFDYGARLTEFTLLGNLAQRAGLGEKVMWDGEKMRVTGPRRLNDYVKLPARRGWRLV
jgi:predicted dehydrogenase